MDRSLKFKLVKDQLRSNALIYRPTIIVGSIMTTLIYVIFSLAESIAAGGFFGATSMGTVMNTLSYVFAIISFFIFFYLNSFVIKSRKRSYGLYSVLGLTKKNLYSLSATESFISFVIQLLAGLILGIILSFLVSNFVLSFLVPGGVVFEIKVQPLAILKTSILFAFNFLSLLVYNRASIARSSLIDLLSAEAQGEKEPKLPWLTAMLAVGLLGVAYYMANQDIDPLAAIKVFPTAVIMVIVGTYLLFGSFSIFMLKALKANKRIYYKPKNFINISNLLFRMKANGAGLATISILFTCAFLTFSVTTTLYAGTNHQVKEEYPREQVYGLYYALDEDLDMSIAEFYADDLRMVQAINSDLAKRAGLKVVDEFVSYEIIGPGGERNSVEASDPVQASDRLTMVYAFDLEGLDDLSNSQTWQNFIDWAKKSDDRAFDLEEILTDSENKKPEQIYYYILHQEITDQWYYGLDPETGELDIPQNLPYNKLYSFGALRSEVLEDMYLVLGSLLFIGFYFIIFFLLASTLVVYFKQLGEAYSDRERYIILQEVGMTEKEVKSTINTQILIMFFSPLFFSVLNVFASYKILWTFLEAMSGQSFDQSNFTRMSLISVLAFTLIYFVVFRLTARVYYRIVRREIA